MGNNSDSKQSVTQLILSWKLGAASVQLLKEQEHLSQKDFSELSGMIERYREWDRMLAKVRQASQNEPAKAAILLRQIPQEVVITYPSYGKIREVLDTTQEKDHLRLALAKCDEAEAFIKEEFNEGKAAKAIAAAKQLMPRWQENTALNERIQNLQVLSSRLTRGLAIQQEISALRENGGQAAYQKALELLSEYDTLGLDSYKMTLFNVQSERDALLKMMVRADGSSWSYRLSSSASEEIVRLEQSIRSLEDAENKNLRVLINNNSRLLSILTSELDQQESDSEQAIQAVRRINELREKNQRFETDILAEVAQRAEEYCKVAKQALDAGELISASSHLRLARDTGKPLSENAEEEFLGEVSLPTSVSDLITQLEEKLRLAQDVRQEVNQKVEEISDHFYSENEITLNTLFSWNNTLTECLKKDSHAPGLEQLLNEVGARYSTARTYLLEKSVYEIDNNLRDGDVDSAKQHLDTLNTFFTSDEDKETLRDQLSKIDRAESIKRQSDALETDLNTIYNNVLKELSCSEADITRAENIQQQVTQIYIDEKISPPKLSTASRESMLRTMQLIKENGADLLAVRNCLAGAEPSDETRKAAETLELSGLFSLPVIHDLLARFWNLYALTYTDDEETTSQYFARAERIAAESDDLELQTQIAQARTEYNLKNEHGRRINMLMETLQKFSQDKAYIESIDFISNSIDTTERNDPQLKTLIERLEQSYRINQASAILDDARSAYAARDLQQAEELIVSSLDFFYTLEGAQLQKTIAASREIEEKNEAELRSFLSADLNITAQDEVNTAHLRYIRERIATLDREQLRDLQLRAEIETMRNQFERLVNQETAEFNAMRNVFDNALISGESVLPQAEVTLSQIEARHWISNFSAEVLHMRIQLGNIQKVLTSLKTVITQVEAFARIGDFRSAKRILNSYTRESLNSCPDWLAIMKENEDERIDELARRYLQVQERFDPSRDKTGGVIRLCAQIFENYVPDTEKVFELQTLLQRERTILEKEICVDNESNVYLTSINFLNEVLRWAYMLSEFNFGLDLPEEGFSMEPLYQLRRMGKSLYENIPPLLIDVQPVLARENKWLEVRTRVRQSLQQINACFQSPGKVARGKEKDIELEWQNVNLITLLPEEKKPLDESIRVVKQTRRTRSCLISTLIGGLILLAAMYYFLPWIVELFAK